MIRLLLSAGKGVVAMSQGDKSASQSSMEIYYPWISGQTPPRSLENFIRNFHAQGHSTAREHDIFAISFAKPFAFTSEFLRNA